MFWSVVTTRWYSINWNTSDLNIQFSTFLLHAENKGDSWFLSWFSLPLPTSRTTLDTSCCKFREQERYPYLKQLIIKCNLRETVVESFWSFCEPSMNTNKQRRDERNQASCSKFYCSQLRHFLNSVNWRQWITYSRWYIHTSTCIVTPFRKYEYISAGWTTLSGFTRLSQIRIGAYRRK